MRIKGKGKSILTRQRLPVLGSAFEFLLDQVSGAAAAYSIRLLRADYSDGLLRVRAFDGSSDQGEADVLPDSNNQISLSSELTNRDSTAGSSNRDVNTLGELVTNTSGTDYDGFVSEWKDQSPNARHATNSTASEQPQLVDSGNLLYLNGKPVLDFDGSNDTLSASITQDTITKQTWFIVHQVDNYNLDNQRVISQTKTGTRDFELFGNIIPLLRDSNNSTLGSFDSAAGTSINTYFQSTGNQILNSLVFNQSGTEISKNGSSQATSTTKINATIDTFFISGIDFNNDNDSDSSIQEVVMYKDDKSAEQIKVESNQNNFYNIF